MNLNELAEDIVHLVMIELRNRGCIDNAFDDVDDETLEEINAALVHVVSTRLEEEMK